MNSTEAYRKFIKLFDFNGNVIYPCCGYDSQPAQVFDDVLFVDKDKKAIDELKKKELNAVCKDVLNLKEKCDLLIVINPSLSAKELLESFNCRHVLCNNLHGTADEMRKIEDFEEKDFGVVGYWLFERR